MLLQIDSESAQGTFVDVLGKYLSGVLLAASAAFLRVCAFIALFANVLVWTYLIFVAKFNVVLASKQCLSPNAF